MEPIEVAAWVTHSVFAGLWTGSVLFLTFAVLPLARDGTMKAGPLASITGKLTTVSRVSALLLLITGGHMAAQRYTSETLVETQAGWLVLSMVALWFLLMAVVEVGSKKVTAGTDQGKLREPARNARPFFLAASVLALLLLVNAGLISANTLGFL